MLTGFEITEWYECNIKPYLINRGKYPYGQPNVVSVNNELFANNNVFRRCEIAYKPNSLYGVLFQPNYITYSVLGNINSVAISFQFSGCYMAKIQARDLNYYACHIYSTGEYSSTDRKEFWHALYANNNFLSCTHFKPIVANSNTDDIYKKLNSNRKEFITCGIIDEHNKCFALLLKQDDLSVVSTGICCSKTYYAREMQPFSTNII